MTVAFNIETCTKNQTQRSLADTLIYDQRWPPKVPDIHVF